ASAADAPVTGESPPPAAPPAGTPAPAPAGAAEHRAPVAPVEVTSAVDLTYYSARELDVQPRALREIVPDYPAAADRRGLSGQVRLLIELEADGRVRDVSVVSANPPGVFEESALTAFREARFAPAQRKGRPVRARVLIEVVYDWEGRT
ncbi:energy transducer TonB, partial [Thiobacillus sp.]